MDASQRGTHSPRSTACPRVGFWRQTPILRSLPSTTSCPFVPLGRVQPVPPRGARGCLGTVLLPAALSGAAAEKAFGVWSDSKEDRRER